MILRIILACLVAIIFGIFPIFVYIMSYVAEYRNREIMNSVVENIFCRIEIIWNSIRKLCGHKFDTSVIPEGMYCYVLDGRSGINDEGNSWQGTKPCPYYRSLNGELHSACTYVGFVGFDLCLGDQCKICNENMPKDLDWSELNGFEMDKPF